MVPVGPNATTNPRRRRSNMEMTCTRCGRLWYPDYFERITGKWRHCRPCRGVAVVIADEDESDERAIAVEPANRVLMENREEPRHGQEPRSQ